MSIHPTHYPTFYRCACELLKEAQLKNILISKKKEAKIPETLSTESRTDYCFYLFFFS